MCWHSSAGRLIETIDGYGPRTHLDDLPLQCERCGLGDGLDVRGRFYQKSVSHPDSPFIEGHGVPSGEKHIWNGWAMDALKTRRLRPSWRRGPERRE